MSTKDPAITPIKAASLAIVVFGCFFIIWQYIIPYFVTKSRVQKAVLVTQAKDLATGHCFDNMVDWWKKPICTKRELAEEGKAIAYIAVSAGRDGYFDTDDDYTAVEIDWNKSKIIGKWAGQRAKRAFEGFKDGVLAPDKFEDETGDDGSPKEPSTKHDWKFWKWNDTK